MDGLTLLGLTAAVFTTAAFLPQVIKTLKTRQTKDMSLVMYVALAIGVSLWLAYGVITGNAPIVLANIITLVLTMILLVLKLKHG